MAIALVDPVTSRHGDTSDYTATWSHAVSGSQRLLLVGVTTNPLDVEPASVVTYNTSQTMTAVGTPQRFTGNFYAVELFALVNPDAGTHDIAVTAYTGCTTVGGIAISLTGVDQTTPLGTPGQTGGTTEALQVTGIASATGEWVVDVAACAYAATVLTADASQTGRAETYWANSGDGNQLNRRMGMSTKPGAASVTMQWSGQNADGWGIIAVSVKPAAASSVTWLRHRA